MALPKRNSERLAARLSKIPESKLGSLLRMAFKLRAEGKELVDLALGTPDYEPPAFLKDAACHAIASGANGYGDSNGNMELRSAIASHFAADQNVTVSQEKEVTITAGASAALSTVVQSLLDPEDKVIVFEPFYEYFLPQLALSGASHTFAKLSPGDWRIEKSELKKALRKNTRAIILNNPHNPTGRVFSQAELEIVAEFCHSHDLIVIADEAYAPFSYGEKYLSIASLPGMKERSVIIHSISKVFNVAGWRVGSIIAPAPLTVGIRRVNSLALGASTPLQQACVSAMSRYDEFMRDTVNAHRLLRDKLETALAAAGFAVKQAEGTFSTLCCALPLGFSNGEDCCRLLLQKHSLLALPANNFFRSRKLSSYVRFCFARSSQTIESASQALSKIAELGAV